MVSEKLFDRIKKPLDLLLGFARNQPLIFSMYCLIFLVGVVFRVYFTLTYGSLQYDESARSVGGIFIARLLNGGLSDPTGYFIRYPLFLGSFWFYPFLYTSLAGLGFSIFGFGEAVARLPSLIFSILLIHATILIAKELGANERVALVSGFFVAFSSWLVIVGSGAMADVAIASLTTYSLLFWIRGMRSQTKSDFLKAGLLGGAAGLMKPNAAFILVFVAIFFVLAYLLAKERPVFSSNFWLGIVGGFALFLSWIFSAYAVNFIIGGWVGQEAVKIGAAWLGLTGYVPAWYSPQWFTVEGWNYYLYQLILTSGFLPLVLSFVGAFHRFRNLRAADVFLILFALGFYVMQTLISNKNPRYILPILPIFYVYAAFGLKYAASNMAGVHSPNPLTSRKIRKIAGSVLVVVVLASSLVGLFSTLEAGYLDFGMGVGTVLPYQESIQILKKDGGDGIVMPDTEDNWFNTPSLTFYLASADPDGRYGCIQPLPNPPDILIYEWGGKKLQYVFVYDLESNVSEFISLNQNDFALLGQAENTYGTIYVYKIGT